MTTRVVNDVLGGAREGRNMEGEPQAGPGSFLALGCVLMIAGALLIFSLGLAVFGLMVLFGVGS